MWMKTVCDSACSHSKNSGSDACLRMYEKVFRKCVENVYFGKSMHSISNVFLHQNKPKFRYLCSFGPDHVDWCVCSDGRKHGYLQWGLFVCVEAEFFPR